MFLHIADKNETRNMPQAPVGSTSLNGEPEVHVIFPLLGGEHCMRFSSFCSAESNFYVKHKTVRCELCNMTSVRKPRQSIRAFWVMKSKGKVDRTLIENLLTNRSAI